MEMFRMLVYEKMRKQIAVNGSGRQQVVIEIDNVPGFFTGLQQCQDL